jgi:hypothetical protein
LIAQFLGILDLIKNNKLLECSTNFLGIKVIIFFFLNFSTHRIEKFVFKILFLIYIKSSYDIF